MNDDKLIWKASPSLLLIVPYIMKIVLTLCAVSALYIIVETSYFDSLIEMNFLLEFVGTLLKDNGIFLVYAGSVILLSLMFGLLWKIVAMSFETYSLDDKRFYFDTGVFNRFNDETELFRVLDYEVEKPFFLRIFGYGNLNLYSNDPSSESGMYGKTFVSVDGAKGMRIVAVKNPDGLKQLIRENVERVRSDRGVKTSEFI